MFVVVEPSHELCSYDYVSMFTNVNVDCTIDIVLQLYHLLLPVTDVPTDVFVRCLRFYTTDTAFFTFGGVLYRQVKGLAMGNRIAQVMAEIRTNFALKRALPVYDASDISMF